MELASLKSRLVDRVRNRAPFNRVAVVIAALMFAAALGAIVARPVERAADLGQPFSLEAMIPKLFGDWREVASGGSQVVNPQLKELLDRSYSQVLSRTYVNPDGYHIMLSLAYGDDQSEREAHDPEVCYPAQGFVIQKNEPAQLATPSGEISVQRLFATMGVRQEPLTYWLVVGDTPVPGKLQKRLVHLRYALGGRVPDGLLFRVSSIDPDQARAYRVQDKFINQLLRAVTPRERKRLSGLGDA